MDIEDLRSILNIDTILTKHSDQDPTMLENLWIEYENYDILVSIALNYNNVYTEFKFLHIGSRVFDLNYRIRLPVDGNIFVDVLKMILDKQIELFDKLDAFDRIDN